MCVLGAVWGKVRGREKHTLLPQFRTVCETVWGLGLNPCLTLSVRPGESQGPCGDGDGWYGEPGQHYGAEDPPGKNGAYAYNGGLCKCH